MCTNRRCCMKLRARINSRRSLSLSRTQRHTHTCTQASTRHRFTYTLHICISSRYCMKLRPRTNGGYFSHTHTHMCTHTHARMHICTCKHAQQEILHAVEATNKRRLALTLWICEGDQTQEGKIDTHNTEKRDINTHKTDL